jgi:hypothetical protein
MRSPVKIALVVVLFVAFAGIGAALYLYKNKPKDLKTAMPDYILTSTALQKAFEENETTASVKYLNKIIEVRGEIGSVKPGENNSLNISLKTGSKLSSVICTFPSVNDPGSIKEGFQITIRGVCSGYLMDVLLNNCAVVISTE